MQEELLSTRASLGSSQITILKPSWRPPTVPEQLAEAQALLSNTTES